VRPYLQTLICNTRALIHLRQGDYLRAQQALQKAEEAVTGTNIQRAIGLVSWTKAEIARWEMKHVDREPKPEIGDFYKRAAQMLDEERDSLRDVIHDHARFLRDLSFWYSQADDQRAATDYDAKALRLLDEAINLLPAGQRPMQRADLMESKVSVLNAMERYAEAGALLDAIEQTVHVPMPAYGQVVCAKLALQRAYLYLADPAQHNEERALREAAIGLARAYVFGMRHREQATFEQLIRLWIGKLVGIEGLTSFVQRIKRDPFYVRLEELPYQQPTLRRWTEAWDASVAFFSDFLVEQQLLKLIAYVEKKTELSEAHDRTALQARLKQAKAQVRRQIDESGQAGRPPSEALKKLLQQAEQLCHDLGAA
jgi:hypothetical protein